MACLISVATTLVDNAPIAFIAVAMFPGLTRATQIPAFLRHLHMLSDMPARAKFDNST